MAEKEGTTIQFAPFTDKPIEVGRETSEIPDEQLAEEADTTRLKEILDMANSAIPVQSS